MRFDTWLMVVHKLTWEMYLALPDIKQAELAREYEASKSSWN